MNRKILFKLTTVLILAVGMGAIFIDLPLRAVWSHALDTSSITLPKRLAIYHAWPSLVNGAKGDVMQATDVFTQFEMVVFGEGLELATHSDHTQTTTIIQKLTTGPKEVFGYIDLGVSSSNLSLLTIENRVNLWAAMGVTGIFFDDAGQEFGVSRSRLISVVTYAHNQGLTAFVNAWNPDDVFSETTPLSATDWYLAESHPVSGDLCPDLDFWWDKSQKLLTYHQASGVQIATMSTGDQGPTKTISDPSYWQSRPAFRQALWATYLFGFDAFGFTNPQYSADPNFPSADYLRPLPPMPTDIGSVYLDLPMAPVTTTGRLTYSRSTNRGTIYVWGEADDPTLCDGAFVAADRLFLPLIIKA